MSELIDDAMIVHLYPSADTWEKSKSSVLINQVFGSLILRQKETAYKSGLEN